MVGKCRAISSGMDIGSVEFYCYGTGISSVNGGQHRRQRRYNSRVMRHRHRHRSRPQVIRTRTLEMTTMIIMVALVVFRANGAVAL